MSDDRRPERIAAVRPLAPRLGVAAAARQVNPKTPKPQQSGHLVSFADLVCAHEVFLVASEDFESLIALVLEHHLGELVVLVRLGARVVAAAVAGDFRVVVAVGVGRQPWTPKKLKGDSGGKRGKKGEKGGKRGKKGDNTPFFSTRYRLSVPSFQS